MARKKTSLATAARRAPALKAAAVGYGSTSRRPLVERRGMQRSAPLAASNAEPAAFQPMSVPARPGEADRDAIETKLCQLVSPHSRVLAIGCDTWPLSRSLSTAGCRVSVVETRHDAPAGSATFSDRVIVGDPETLDLDKALGGTRFDAIVAVRLLEQVRDPVRMLTALAKYLSADGRIVAAVPNVMHGRIRLGFLAGRSPAGLLSPDMASPSHWYDGAAVQRTFDRAGFVITTINRHLEPFDADAVPLNGLPLPTAIVDDLMRDADAMTRTFVVVAHPFRARAWRSMCGADAIADHALEQLRALSNGG